MLAYAPRPERRRLNRTALALILGAHSVAILAIMSAKMEVIRGAMPPTIVELIPNKPPPEPAKAEPRAPDPAPSPPISAPDPVIPLPLLPGPIANPLPSPAIPVPTPGTGVDPLPPKPIPIVRTGPRFATRDDDIRPPYPESRRASGEEAVLRLKLAIDARGRVVAVEPVGRPDPVFLDAARRHILRSWRYRPAMEGEQAIASTTVVTLKFELD